MIGRQNFIDGAVNNYLRAYGNIKRIATAQRDDHTTGCLLDYSYYRKHHKMIAIDISKQKVIDADEEITVLFINEEVKKWF